MPVTTGEDAHELRVHGVAGTPPEAMLQLGAVWVDGPGGDPGAGRPWDVGVSPRPSTVDQITLWRAPRRDGRVRAWSWSSLTSGRWYQAFYLLLLPFMIANLAGWMVAGRAPGGSSEAGVPAALRTRRLRWTTLLVRLAGLLVTVVFVVSVQLVVADLVAWQWWYRADGSPLWVVALGPLGTAAVFGVLVVLTRIRPKPEELAPGPRPSLRARWAALGEQWRRPRDPVGIGFLTRAQWLLWNSGAINVALRRLHLATGLAVIALLTAWPVGGTSLPWLRTLTLALALLTLVGVLVLLGWIGLRRGCDAPPTRELDDEGDPGAALAFRLVRTVVVWPAVVAVLLAAVVPLGWSEPLVRQWATLPALRGSAVWVTLAVVALVVALTAVDRGGRRLATPGAVLLLAASTGAEFGAGVISRAAGLVGGIGDFPPVVDRFVDWLAVAVTTSLAALVLVAATRWLVLRARGVPAVPALTARASWLTAALGGIGLLLTALVIVQVFRGADVADLPRWFAPAVVLALVVPVVAVASVLVAERGTAWFVAASVGGAVVAAVLGWAVRTGRSLRFAGVDVPPPTFAEFCLAIAVVLPTAAILGRIYLGLRHQGVRRGVGVLWDVGTFWPRWFHPLAPPTYSDRAVPQLMERIRAEGTVLLAPHSQGAVIANAALLLDAQTPGDRAHVALLSYGSPWQRLYAEFFPSQVDQRATAAVCRRVDGRWVNLWRATDPIGGPIPGTPHTTAIRRPRQEGHSDYWVEPAYRAAVRFLRGRAYSGTGNQPVLGSTTAARAAESRGARPARAASDRASPTSAPSRSERIQRTSRRSQ